MTWKYNNDLRRVWADILNKPLKYRAFNEFIAELMNCPVDYEDKSTHEDAGNTAGVSNTNSYSHRGKISARYISYAEFKISTIKYTMASPHQCVGGTQNPGFPRRASKRYS